MAELACAMNRRMVMVEAINPSSDDQQASKGEDIGDQPDLNNHHTIPRPAFGKGPEAASSLLNNKHN